MSTPVKPPKLYPDHVYVHITSPLQPSDIASASATSPQQLQLEYVAPVGELKYEHIFEVEHLGQPVKRDSSVWTNDGQGFVQRLKAIQGVKAVQVMDLKKREKRSSEVSARPGALAACLVLTGKL